MLFFIFIFGICALCFVGNIYNFIIFPIVNHKLNKMIQKINNNELTYKLLMKNLRFINHFFGEIKEEKSSKNDISSLITLILKY